jgi:pimeloyl-ACP methyl ester carboxylesterase
MTTPARRAGFRLIALLGAPLGVFARLLVPPVSAGDLARPPNPAASYHEALERVEALRAQSHQASLHPACQLRLMTHGQKQPRAIVLVHGYTSCPEQFAALGRRFHAQGCNVLIPLLPHHGLADLMTDAHRCLTAEDLACQACDALDIARGLGDHVTMLGLSGGGLITAWAAQQRADLDLAMPVAPAFGYRQLPTNLTALAMNAYLLLPNSYVWWDPKAQADPASGYGYPRFATRALAQLLRMGQAVLTAASRQPPAAAAILLVTNASDLAVNNDLTARVASLWRSHGANLHTYEFPASLELPHDLISGLPSEQAIEHVYGQLVALALAQGART